ncbi:MAG: hypothetical protein GYA21_14045, partial [Myxococcales bacterium]|nr:hypothetical protein [Myxococcales bacterium]
LNCVANARLLAEGPFRRVWIQPAAGDAGGALGAALLVWHQLLERPRPMLAVAHSPTPSTVSTAASANGEGKKAEAACDWWCEQNRMRRRSRPPRPRRISRRRRSLCRSHCGSAAKNEPRPRGAKAR